MQQLALEKLHLEETVKSLRARCADMEEQCVQHGRMHQRMKDRYEKYRFNMINTLLQIPSIFLYVFRNSIHFTVKKIIFLSVVILFPATLNGQCQHAV